MLHIHKLYDNSLYREISEERKVADELVNKLKYFIPHDTEGDIYVLPSMRCPNGDKKDLDLVVWFDFKKYLIKDVISGHYTFDNEEKLVETFRTKKNIFFNNALCIFEIKRHNRQDNIKINDQRLEVYYSQNKQWKDATEQSEGQKHSLINFLRDRLNLKSTPYVHNFIWMYETGDWKPSNYNILDNVLWGSFNFDIFINAILYAKPPLKQANGIYSYNSSSTELTDKVSKYFIELKENKSNGLGALTRRKIQQILEHDINIDNADYASKIGSKLIILKGDPGTGKTLHLIHIAHHLVQQKNAKCLILTYNKALERDINRLCFHIGASDTLYLKTMTFHGFVFSVLKNNNLITNAIDYVSAELDAYIIQLMDLLNGENEPKKTLNVFFDFVLIDEAQDWSELQKTLIFSLFGSQNTILSYGKHQEISGVPLDWGVELQTYEKEIINLKISHRNKINLVNYFNDYSQDSIRAWRLKCNNKLVGGKIIIFQNEFDRDAMFVLNEQLCVEKNAPYDLMILAPHNDELNKIEEKLNNWGYKTYNGGTDNRAKEFPTDEFRLLNYNSCRGLEAWIVICWKLDIYLDGIAKYYLHPLDASFTIKEGIEMEQNKWLFMIFTRAIDTLVITFDNKNSIIAKNIITLAESCFQGIVEWY